MREHSKQETPPGGGFLSIRIVEGRLGTRDNFKERSCVGGTEWVLSEGTTGVWLNSRANLENMAFLCTHIPPKQTIPSLKIRIGRSPFSPTGRIRTDGTHFHPEFLKRERMVESPKQEQVLQYWTFWYTLRIVFEYFDHQCTIFCIFIITNVPGSQLQTVWMGPSNKKIEKFPQRKKKVFFQERTPPSKKRTLPCLCLEIR